MANHNWVVKTRQFLEQDITKLKLAKSDNDLRLAVMDSHAVLEYALRGYLRDVCGVEGIADKSKWSFPSVVQALRQQTGDSIISVEKADDILAFNMLRNRVVHETHYPSPQEVQSGLAVIADILKMLVTDEVKPYPSWQSPFHSLANLLGGNATYGLGAMMIVFSVLYILNPVDIPGPIDDFGVTAPCLFSAVLLINAARLIRNKSSKK